MNPADRRQRIITLINEQGRASVEELADLLKTSRETVRRDLVRLSEQDAIRKVHGGAVRQQTAYENPFDIRVTSQSRQKAAIARAAASLFGSGDSLLIDSG